MLTRGLRPGPVVLLAVATLAVAWPALATWSDAGHALPAAGWPVLLPILAVAAMTLAGAWSVRRLARGRRPAAPHDGLRSVRVLAMCQAAALTGAVVAGGFAALAAVGRAALALEGWSSPAAAALAAAFAGVLLAVVGLVGQSWCRLAPPIDGDQPSEDDSSVADG